MDGHGDNETMVAPAECYLKECHQPAKFLSREALSNHIKKQAHNGPAFFIVNDRSESSIYSPRGYLLAFSRAVIPGCTFGGILAVVFPQDTVKVW